jgi:hypothetical protein
MHGFKIGDRVRVNDSFSGVVRSVTPEFGLVTVVQDIEERIVTVAVNLLDLIPGEDESPLQPCHVVFCINEPGKSPGLSALYVDGKLRRTSGHISSLDLWLELDSRPCTIEKRTLFLNCSSWPERLVELEALVNQANNANAKEAAGISNAKKVTLPEVKEAPLPQERPSCSSPLQMLPSGQPAKASSPELDAAMLEQFRWVQPQYREPVQADVAKGPIECEVRHSSLFASWKRRKLIAALSVDYPGRFIAITPASSTAKTSTTSWPMARIEIKRPDTSNPPCSIGATCTFSPGDWVLVNKPSQDTAWSTTWPTWLREMDRYDGLIAQVYGEIEGMVYFTGDMPNENGGKYAYHVDWLKRVAAPVAR